MGAEILRAPQVHGLLIPGARFHGKRYFAVRVCEQELQVSASLLDQSLAPGRLHVEAAWIWEARAWLATEVW